MPLYSSATSGLSALPLFANAGNETPTIIAQPFYRQLDSIAWTFQAAIGPAVDRIFFLEFLESGSVFNSVFIAQAYGDGSLVHGTMAQRIATQSVNVGSEFWTQTSLPVAYWVEPNVEVRLRCLNGDATDLWSDVVAMMSAPQKEVPASLKG